MDGSQIRTMEKRDSVLPLLRHDYLKIKGRKSKALFAQVCYRDNRLVGLDKHRDSYLSIGQNELAYAETKD